MNSSKTETLNKMKTIKQQTEVEFYAPSVQDVIILLPVMDSLCDNRNMYLKNWEEEGKKKDSYYCKKLVEVEEQIAILLNLGFMPSSPSMLQNFNVNSSI